MPLPGFWDLPGTRPVSSHFTHSPYATGALPAVVLVLNPRVGGFIYILRWYGSFKRLFLKIRQFLPLAQPPLDYTARSEGNLSSQRWNPRLCGLAWGWDRWLPRYPSRFLSTTSECGTARACFAATTACPSHTASLCLSTLSPLLHPSYPSG